MNTSQTPSWYEGECEILNGDQHIATFSYGDIAKWLELHLQDWDEEDYGEPCPEITEDLCDDYAESYLEYLKDCV